MNDQQAKTTEQTPQHYHKHTVTLLVVGFMAIALLFFMAYSVQRTNSFTFSFTPPAPTPTPNSSGNIIVTSPYSGEHVAQTFTVTGKARVEQNLVSIRLRDKYSGQVITEGRVPTTASGPGKFGDYSADLQITDESIRSEAPLVLEIYQISPRNGREIDKVTIPIVFSPESL